MEEKKKQAIINSEYKKLKDILIPEEAKNIQKMKEQNQFCPKCKSEKTVKKIKRIKGEGKSSSKHIDRSFLFSHHHEHRSSSNFELDTIAVMHCNKCGHEWYVKKIYITVSDILKNKIYAIRNFQQNQMYIKNNFVRKNVGVVLSKDNPEYEKEKAIKLKEMFKEEQQIVKFFSGYHIETFIWLVQNMIDSDRNVCLKILNELTDKDLKKFEILQFEPKKEEVTVEKPKSFWRRLFS